MQSLQANSPQKPLYLSSMTGTESWMSKWRFWDCSWHAFDYAPKSRRSLAACLQARSYSVPSAADGWASSTHLATSQDLYAAMRQLLPWWLAKSVSSRPLTWNRKSFARRVTRQCLFDASALPSFCSLLASCRVVQALYGCSVCGDLLSFWVWQS